MGDSAGRCNILSAYHLRDGRVIFVTQRLVYMGVFITDETFKDATYNYGGLLLDGEFYVFGGGSILGSHTTGRRIPVSSVGLEERCYGLSHVDRNTIVYYNGWRIKVNAQLLRVTRVDEITENKFVVLSMYDDGPKLTIGWLDE